VRGKVLRVSGREIGKIRERLKPFFFLAAISIVVELADFESFLAQALPKVKAANLDLLTSSLRHFITFYIHTKLSADEVGQLREERKELTGSTGDFGTLMGVLNRFVGSADVWGLGLSHLGVDGTAPKSLLGNAGAQVAFLDGVALMLR
jgi:hypothetical protein